MGKLARSVIDFGESLMFTNTKSLRVLLRFLLAASVLIVWSPSASAAPPTDGYYGCNSGEYRGSSSGTGKYQILSGEVTGGGSCVGAVVIPNGVTSIGARAFEASRLASIFIPSSVTSVLNLAFLDATSLTSVTFEANSQLSSIAYGAFTYSGLTSIVIPRSVTSIGDFAFHTTASLTDISFESNSLLTSIGDQTFDVSGLTSLTIPTSVTSIGNLAFDRTPSLTTYTYCGNADVTNTGLAGKTRISVCSLAGLSSAFSSTSSYDGRFTVQVSNYDSAFTYVVTSSAGQASINSTGLITVTGLRPDQSVTVTMTTSRSGYDTTTSSVTGRSRVAPMLPTNKPTVTISDTLITCTIGSYSATPTSSAFSLFVDGKHVSTIFSALGEYLPDWIIPWATSSSITRTASLTSATWTMSDAYKGKAITCATLAYSKNAIGFTASQVMVAR